MAKRLKILVADDHAATREHLHAWLGALDMTVIEAADGREAIACFEREHPDWTLMDIEMPVMDGIQATRAILERNPDARVIVVTQYADSIWKEEALRAGASEFLVKDNLTQISAILNQTPLDHPNLNQTSQ